VPPAAPTSLQAKRIIISGYGLNNNPSVTIPRKVNTAKPKLSGPALLAKRGKVGGVIKGGKVQVKLLKYVEGTGKIGDIVQVAPAFFENKLKRTNSAVLISDEEVEQQNAERSAADKLKQAIALDMKSKIDDIELQLAKKAGPEGHLFGGVGKKDILKELKDRFPVGALDGKQIKIISVHDEDGNEVKGDIKVLGTFSTTIELLKDITAKFSIVVNSE